MCMYLLCRYWSSLRNLVISLLSSMRSILSLLFLLLDPARGQFVRTVPEISHFSCILRPTARIRLLGVLVDELGDALDEGMRQALVHWLRAPLELVGDLESRRDVAIGEGHGCGAGGRRRVRRASADIRGRPSSSGTPAVPARSSCSAPTRSGPTG